MSRFLRHATLTAAAVLTAVALSGPVLAADVELLPDGLMTPTTKEQTKPNQFKKAPPWRIGVSFGGVGNTWIVQMIQEMKYAASQNKNIGEFIFVEANWQAAKQVADVEDLLTKKVDAIIIGPISAAIGAPLAEKAVQGRHPGGRVRRLRQGDAVDRRDRRRRRGLRPAGRRLPAKELKGKGSVWAFRGIAGVDEEALRYNGFKKSLDGTDIKITQEVFGDWNYAKGKQLCENLVLSGNAVDGIWFSGAEMTRACIDVFKESGKPLVPMTGEGNNGFLRVWKQTGVKSVAPLFTPGLGAATVRASVALLEGKPMYRSYFSSPPPMNQADLDKFFRPDLSDAYWLPSTLPEATLKETFRR